MLVLDFINVGDGDAILVRDTAGPGFTMLIDAGRADVFQEAGENRLTAAQYLKQEGISRIHLLVITHLHVDHMGGIQGMLPDIQVDRLVTGYLPPTLCAGIPEEPNAQKKIRGLIECLNLWQKTVQALQAGSCSCQTIAKTTRKIPLTKDLSMDLYCPDETEADLQRRIFDSMFRREDVPEQLKYRASASRNPDSLRVRLHYAGREVELSGDCYGSVWEDEAEPCDIFKVPHHGDAKSVTYELVRKLHPIHAVVSCGNRYTPGKDRPSAQKLLLLQQQDAQLWFTDSFSADWHVPQRWQAVRFAISEDGAIEAPKSSLVKTGRRKSP